jgi:putative ABC transport system permease protein
MTPKARSARIPKSAEWMIRFCERELDEAKRGDYEEIFHDCIEESGIRRGRCRFWFYILCSFFLSIKNYIYWRMMMFQNYFKVALRNLRGQRLYSAINIIGLAVGITCVLFILFYVQHELRYDRYHEKADRIYRLAVSIRMGGNELERAIVGAPTAQAMIDDFPEVEDAVRLKTGGNWYIRYGDKTYKETDFIFADANVLDIFSIPLLEGDPQTALKESNTLIISQTAAKKYFGSDDPVGKTLNLDNSIDFQVTGVFQDIPSYSHFHWSFIGSMVSVEKRLVMEWTSLDVYTYLLLGEGADPDALEAKFPAMVEKYCDQEFKTFTGKVYAQLKESGTKWEYFLQPLTSIHLHSNLGFELEPNSDIKYIYIFSTIALFCLLIASINFVNLSTARSAKRAREVGIRKVVGSARSQLIVQFITESVLMSVAALFVALVLVRFLQPAFHSLIGREIDIHFLSHPFQILILAAIIVFVGIIAGIYPAFVLSSFKPVSVLKQQMKGGSRTHWLRSALVVFQFLTSIVLIIGTLIIHNQMRYIQNKDLGFQKDQVLVVQDAFILGQKIEAFKEELKQNPDVVSATITSYLPVLSNRRVRSIFPEGQKEQKGFIAVQAWRADHDFIKTFNMNILQGRDFSREYSTDSTAAIINETAADMLGWDNPIGKRIGVVGSSKSGKYQYFTIIGVVKNFHFDSMRETIMPLALYLEPSSEFLAVRLQLDNVSEEIEYIRKLWDKYLPGYPFAFSFLDDRFENMYKSELRSGQILNIFSALAVIISCLGLFGLSAYMAEQRTKEIGIRKVLGASVPEILLLLSKEYCRLVLIGFLMAAPLSYFVMRNWLQDFAYRTSIDIWPFVISVALALLISFVTVSYYASRLALSSPAESLRYE